MLNTMSLSVTLPMLLAGMVGIFLVIGVIVAAVYMLGRIQFGRGSDGEKRE